MHSACFLDHYTAASLPYIHLLATQNHLCMRSLHSLGHYIWHYVGAVYARP